MWGQDFLLEWVMVEEVEEVGGQWTCYVHYQQFMTSHDLFAQQLLWDVSFCLGFWPFNQDKSLK